MGWPSCYIVKVLRAIPRRHESYCVRVFRLLGKFLKHKEVLEVFNLEFVTTALAQEPRVLALLKSEYGRKLGQ